MEIEVASENSDSIPDPARIQELIIRMCKELSLTVHHIHVIFVNDHKIRQLHHDYLNDDSPTDVITFNLSNSEDIEAEIYISEERANDQAIQYGVPLHQETDRLIIHALLHLAGYKDETDTDRLNMKKQENKYVDLFSKPFNSEYQGSL